MQRATLDAIERAWERANDVPDILDPELPESVVDDELLALGVDPSALAKRAIDFVAAVKDDGFDPPDHDDYVDGEGDGEVSW